MAASLAAAKQQLRSLMKSKLAALPLESVAKQSSVLFNTLLAFKPYVEAQRVSVFLSMSSSEVQTDAIVRHALAAGKQVFVPYLHKSPLDNPGTPRRVMDMVQLKSIVDYESLQPDRWGIPSIDPATVYERRRILGGPDAQHSDRATLDLILMPGVAFDVDPESGRIRRCGHGRGFYDFFLDRYAAKMASLGAPPSALLCGLALVEQFLPSSPVGVEAIPVGPLDCTLDSVITGDGVIRTSKGR